MGRPPWTVVDHPVFCSTSAQLDMLSAASIFPIVRARFSRSCHTWQRRNLRSGTEFGLRKAAMLSQGRLRRRELLRRLRAGDFGPARLQHDALALVICESEDLRTMLAQPVMLHAGGFEGHSFVRVKSLRLRPKAKELAASQPVKSGRATRVGTLGMHVLEKRLSLASACTGS